VLGLLRDTGPRSRAEIASATGLTKATVTSLVNDLVERGLVTERDVTHTGQSGRPSRPLETSGQRVAGVGLEVEADRLVGVIADLTGEPVVERHAVLDGPWPGDEEATTRKLSSFATALFDEAQQRSLLVAGVCISVPVLIDQPHGGRGGCEANLGWDPGRLLPALTSEVTRRFRRLPEVSLEIESNLVALAETRSGCFGPGANLLCLVGRRGVSAGALLDGSLRRGASGHLGEVGHMVVDPSGSRCCCGGRGCWQTVVGLPAILREAAPDLAGEHGERSSLSYRLRLLVERAKAGDQRALEGLGHVGGWLGVGLASLINVFNPDAVVLCGYLRELAPWLLEPALESLDRHCVGPSRSACTVVSSQLNGSAAALGAAMLASGNVFDDPMSVPK
jgi:predicted NBD/HSP70 family sugar kinase